MTDKLYKLELGLQGESVDGQEAIEGSSIDQLYDEICIFFVSNDHPLSILILPVAGIFNLVTHVIQSICNSVQTNCINNCLLILLLF